MLNGPLGPAVVFGVLSVVLPGLFALSSPPAVEPPRRAWPSCVVFDQLRGDYLERWDDLFGDGGFRRLEHEGAWFQNCHYPYANTVTGAGHASVATGCSPHVTASSATSGTTRGRRPGQLRRVASTTARPAPAGRREGGRTARSEEVQGRRPDRLRAPAMADALKEATGGRARSCRCRSRTAAPCCPAASTRRLLLVRQPRRAVRHLDLLPRPAAPLGRRLQRGPAPRTAGSARSGPACGPTWITRSTAARTTSPARARATCQGVAVPAPASTAARRSSSSTTTTQLYNSPFGNDLLLELAEAAVDAEGLGTPRRARPAVPQFLVQRRRRPYLGAGLAGSAGRDAAHRPDRQGAAGAPRRQGRQGALRRGA